MTWAHRPHGVRTRGKKTQFCEVYAEALGAASVYSVQRQNPLSQ